MARLTGRGGFKVALYSVGDEIWAEDERLEHGAGDTVAIT